MTRGLLHAAHIWIWALYYGPISYNYYMLYPRMQREFFESEARYEEFAVASAMGLRWWIFGAIAMAGVTGLLLVIWPPRPEMPPAWWMLVGAKTVLMTVLAILYAYVSWVMWPRRVFAPPAERPRLQRQFFRIAFLIGFLLLCQLILGALAHVAAAG